MVQVLNRGLLLLLLLPVVISAGYLCQPATDRLASNEGRVTSEQVILNKDRLPANLTGQVLSSARPVLCSLEGYPPVLDTGNVYGKAKFSGLFKPLNRVKGAGAIQGTRAYTAGDNYSVWALDSWKAYNTVDDDNDGWTDFSDQDWDEAIYLINATVRAVSERAVYLHDLSCTEKTSYSQETATAFLQEFDETIYPSVTGFAGNPPDINADGKILVVLTDIRDGVYHGRGGEETGGYFWPLHSTANTGSSVYRYSNESEIVFLDSRVFETGENSTAGGLLAHEFQHLVHFSSDDSEELWLDEGLSVHAQWASGYHGSTAIYTDAFNKAPWTSLTYFRGTPASYGIAFLFVHYLQDIISDSGLKELVSSKDTGMASAARLVTERGVETSSLELFFSFMTALVTGKTGSPLTIQPAVTGSFPVDIEAGVESWGTRFYQLPPATGYQPVSVNVTFTGDHLTRNGAFSTFFFLTVIKYSGSVHAGTDLLIVDGETDAGQAELAGYGVDFDRCIIGVHLLAGTGSGTSATNLVPEASFKAGFELTGTSGLVMTGDLYHYPSTGAVNFTDLRFYEQGREIRNDTLAIDGASWKITAGGKKLVNGELLWRDDSKTWATGEVPASELAQEIWLEVTFTITDRWVDNGTRTFKKEFYFAGGKADGGLLLISATTTGMVLGTVALAAITKKKK